MDIDTLNKVSDALSTKIIALTVPHHYRRSHQPSFDAINHRSTPGLSSTLASNQTALSRIFPRRRRVCPDRNKKRNAILNSTANNNLET
ncbi:hypothetical protein NL676_035707 [Syzygium grande]|nr:hypothetical protein NL676_035707 [Syzygium grande]